MCWIQGLIAYESGEYFFCGQLNLLLEKISLYSNSNGDPKASLGGFALRSHCPFAEGVS